MSAHFHINCSRCFCRYSSEMRKIAHGNKQNCMHHSIWRWCIFLSWYWYSENAKKSAALLSLASNFAQVYFVFNVKWANMMSIWKLGCYSKNRPNYVAILFTVRAKSLKIEKNVCKLRCRQRAYTCRRHGFVCTNILNCVWNKLSDDSMELKGKRDFHFARRLFALWFFSFTLIESGRWVHLFHSICHVECSACSMKWDLFKSFWSRVFDNESTKLNYFVKSDSCYEIGDFVRIESYSLFEHYFFDSII